MKNKMHLIPAAVQDCAENAMKTRNSNEKYAYIDRLQAIKEYCEQVLLQIDQNSIYKDNTIGYNKPRSRIKT